MAVRFIRARAETTWRSAACPSPSSVHPRPRGDDSSRVTRSKFATGSSAPARRRRTPCSAAGGRSPVHPRPRGDDGLLRLGVGSGFRFIRARAETTDGKPGLLTSPGRFIRARAETTWPCSGRGTVSSVHPRPRGDDGLPAPWSQRRCSVHPRPRGDDLARARTTCPPSWFIRARAETTSATSVHAATRGGSSAPARRRRQTGAADHRTPSVHPRPRGDDAPQVAEQRRAARFIRARAETTIEGRVGSRSLPVHPRPRGDDKTGQLFRPLLSGSSAPARRRHFEIARLCATPDSRCVRTIRISRQTTLQRPSAGYG